MRVDHRRTKRQPRPAIVETTHARRPGAAHQGTPQAEPEVTRAAERQSPVSMRRVTRRDMLWRLSGVALFAAAAGSSLIHRHVLSLAANHAASALEMGLGLTSFVLASLGVLLMMHGAGLHDRSDGSERRTSARSGHAGHPDDHMDPAMFGTGRDAIAALLAHRTHAHRARTQNPPR